MSSNWYEISYPKKVVNRDNAEPNEKDWVGYVVKENGVVVEKNDFIKCYHKHMGHLSAYEFTCFPRIETTSPGVKVPPTKSFLPYDIFCQWIELCKSHGIMVKNATPFEDGGKNCCIIDGTGVSRHIVYASLCCYRWAENQSRLAYLAVKLLELKPDLNFFQVLAYAMSRHVSRIGHTFCAIHRKQTTFFLADALLVAYFFGLDKHGASEAQKKWKADGCHYYDTNTTLSIESRNLFVEKFRLPGPEYYLHSAWADLFTLEKPTKEKILDCYNSTKDIALTTPI